MQGRRLFHRLSRQAGERSTSEVPAQSDGSRRMLHLGLRVGSDGITVRGGQIQELERFLLCV